MDGRIFWYLVLCVNAFNESELTSNYVQLYPLHIFFPYRHVKKWEKY